VHAAPAAAARAATTAGSGGRARLVHEMVAQRKAAPRRLFEQAVAQEAHRLGQRRLVRIRG
jgi:hypothetical protein